MLWFARFTPLTVKRTRAALAFPHPDCRGGVRRPRRHRPAARGDAACVDRHQPVDSFAGFSFAP